MAGLQPPSPGLPPHCTRLRPLLARSACPGGGGGVPGAAQPPTPELPGWRSAWGGASRGDAGRHRGACTPKCTVEGGTIPTAGSLRPSQRHLNPSFWVRLGSLGSVCGRSWCRPAALLAPALVPAGETGSAVRPAAPRYPPGTPRFPGGPRRALAVTQSSLAHLAEPSSTRRCVTLRQVTSHGSSRKLRPKAAASQTAPGSPPPPFRPFPPPFPLLPGKFSVGSHFPIFSSKAW